MEDKKKDFSKLMEKLEDEKYVKLLEEIEEKNNEKILSETDKNKLHIISTDCYFSLQHRLKAVNTYYKLFPENTGDIINKIGSMYIFSSGIKSLEEYLYAISIESEIDIYFKIECAKFLSNYSDKCYDCLKYNLETKESEKLSTPYKLESIYLLMKFEKYKEDANTYFLNIIEKNELDCLYRYKSILHIENLELEQSVKNYFIFNGLVCFSKNKNNQLRLIILCCQYICCKFRDYCKYKYTETQDILLSISQDENTEYNIKADSSDVLLQYGSDEYKNKALKIIEYLGMGKNKTKTIFENAQNVHTKSIEESSNKLIDFLLENNPHIKHDFEKVCELIKEKCKDLTEEDKENSKKINSSLLRISIDRSIYGKNNLSLERLLCLVYTHIEKSEHKDEMFKRLLEELTETSEICSFGYVTRILNVLSGFEGEFGIRIGYDDQIIANVKAKLNKAIMDLDDEKYAGDILEEMTISNDNYDQRKNFLKFFRENISKIREELRKEYIQNIDESDFDLYFKKAILHYEGY